MAILRKKVFYAQEELKLFQRKDKKSKWYKKKVKPSIGVTGSNQASLGAYKKGTSSAKSNPNQASVVQGQEHCTTTQPNTTSKVPLASGHENNWLQGKPTAVLKFHWLQGKPTAVLEFHWLQGKSTAVLKFHWLQGKRNVKLHSPITVPKLLWHLRRI